MASHWELPDSDLPENLASARKAATSRKYDDEVQNLIILSEEAGEIVRMVSKTLRFGLDNFHPKNEFANREALAREIGHLFQMASILMDNGTIKAEDVNAGSLEKLEKLMKWYGAAGSMLPKEEVSVGEQ